LLREEKIRRRKRNERMGEKRGASEGGLRGVRFVVEKLKKNGQN
jgi:hypothetical protein